MADKTTTDAPTAAVAVVDDADRDLKLEHLIEHKTTARAALRQAAALERMADAAEREAHAAEVTATINTLGTVGAALALLALGVYLWRAG